MSADGEEQKVTNERKLSEIIAEFLKLTASARASYEYFSGEMDKADARRGSQSGALPRETAVFSANFER